jgi:hypothetical protein
MKKSLFYFVIALLSTIIISSCGTKTTINEGDASEVIVEYLSAHPEYSTTNFEFGEIKFKGKGDAEDLAKYKALEDNGLIKMTLQDSHKRFLSKDSTYIYTVELTSKAAPLVLKQGNNRATVKSATYVLDDSKPVNFEKVNNKTAKATVSLKKEPTDFAPFQRSGNASDFMTKTYRLKLKKDEGWVVTGG